LGLTGYVKNLPNGSVYIEAEGSMDKLNKLLEFSKEGPRNAQVERVEHEFKTPKSQYNSFDYAF
jgi:acylphosphatase